jgi:plasmid stability protein
MTNILVRDLSPELEATLRGYAKMRGLDLSQAALEILERSLASEGSKAASDGGVGTSDYLSETLKEALHTKDEAEAFIRTRE